MAVFKRGEYNAGIGNTWIFFLLQQQKRQYQGSERAAKALKKSSLSIVSYIVSIHILEECL